MKPFLRQAAEKFLAEGNVSGKCFIFPNRRSLVFFRKHLAAALSEAFSSAAERGMCGASGSDPDSGPCSGSDPALGPGQEAPVPIIAPEMLTVNDFFYKVYDVPVTDRVILLLELYECYKTLNGKAEPLDEFIFWGDVILGDFNDVDKYLVDPKQIFTNVSDYKAMQDTFSYLSGRQRQAIEGFVSHFNDRSGRLTVRLDSDNPNVKERFLMIWNILYPLYTSFRSRLKEKNEAYEGMVYRDIAELISGNGAEDFAERLRTVFPRSEKYVFVGLNALNECEKTLLRRMRDRGMAEFCWDYSGKMIRDRRNRSSLFMEENVREFPQKYEWDEGGLGIPHIRIMSVPSSVGQVKQIPQILSSAMSEEGVTPDDCAVVLPDETLLMPLLNTIPPDIRDINVTMGYPMAGSAFHTFMNAVTAVQMYIRPSRSSSGQNDELFYYKPVWTLFSDAIFRKVMTADDREAVRKIKSEVRTYIPRKDLSGTPLLDLLFAPVLHDLRLPDGAQVDALAGHQLKVAAFVASALAEDVDMAVEVTFAKEYWKNVSRLRTISLQVKPMTYMRILEQLLAGVSVPFNGEPLKGLQIMGPLETRALDFRNLVILSANEGIFPRRNVSSSFIPPELRRGFGLPSYEFQDAVWAYYFYRMISRAENVWMLYDSRAEGMKSGEESRYIRQLEYHFRLPVERYIASSPVKAGSVAMEIEKTADDVRHIKDGALSATALQNYLMCPARFYYQSVLGLSAETEVSESMDAAMIGKVYHGVMQRLYSGRTAVGLDYLESLAESVSEIKSMVWELMLEELHSPEVAGRNLVIGDVIVKYVLKTIERDKEQLEARGSGEFEILGLEKRLECEFGGFRFKGYIDRMDSFAPDEVRVVDYKTGKVHQEDMQITEADGTKAVDKLFGDGPFTVKPKIALQLFIYDLLLEKNGLSHGRRVIDSVYSTAQLFIGPPAQAEVGRSFYNAMSEHLAVLLDDISDISKPFSRIEDLSVCQYCDFKAICGR